MMFAVSSCKDDDEADLVGNWVDRYNFEGVARSGAVTFTIGDKAYVVSGYDGVERKWLNDCWEFDAEKNQWTSMDAFPAIGRTGACAFAVNEKGYVIGGNDGDNAVKLKDVWEFNPKAPAGTQWTQKNDFASTARYGAVAFAVNNTGFVCSGYDGNNLKDLWKYNPDSDSWTQCASIPGSKRYNASVFIIDNIVYLVGGNSNNTWVDDFWAYDYSTDSWTEKRDINDNNEDESFDNDYTTIPRQNGVAFTIGKLGYYATGDRNGSAVNTTWEYNPATDLWIEKTAFEGAARTQAIGFTINDRGFVLLGKSGSSYFDDVWEFKPTEEYEKNY
ncbi:MAG: galactose oxidase [Bacteroidales bacterium]|nr:galactose oxidase [Bacteroidales bacterium]